MNICVQCHKELAEYQLYVCDAVADQGYILICICLNPECPNYSLVTLGEKNMIKEKVGDVK